MCKINSDKLTGKRWITSLWTNRGCSLKETEHLTINWSNIIVLFRTITVFWLYFYIPIWFSFHKFASFYNLVREVFELAEMILMRLEQISDFAMVKFYFNYKIKNFSQTTDRNIWDDRWHTVGLKDVRSIEQEISATSCLAVGLQMAIGWLY